MNSTLSTNFVHDNLNASKPAYVIDKFNLYFQTFYELLLHLTFSVSFHYLIVGGCFFLNRMVKESSSSRKEYQSCLYLLIIYGLLINIPPPFMYELVPSNIFFSLLHISSEALRNIAIFLRVLSTYLVVIFALYCYYIVFRNTIKRHYSKFYVYFPITFALIFCLLLTLLLLFLRHFLFDESNPYCHFHIMTSIQSFYCPETTYWLVFVLLIYIIPMVIPFLVYPRIIYEVVTKYEVYRCGYVKYLVDDNRKKYLFKPDYRFLKLSFILALVFLLTNIPFVIIEILSILQIQINVRVAIFFEIIARYGCVSYPWICIKFKLRNGEPRDRRPSKMQSLLVDCEAKIKEQDELLKVMRVSVKTVPVTEVKTEKFTNEIQDHCEEL